MKKIIAIILSLTALCSVLTGCQKPATTTPETTAAPEVDALYDPAMPNKLRNAQVAEFPMSTADTPYAQRRQQCVDFFRLHLEFQWKPNIDVSDYVSYYFGYNKSLLKDNLYEGIPYGGTSSGNIYRWLEYYDETTGIMDLETAFKENGGWGEDGYVDGLKKTDNGTFPRYRSYMALFNQCSSAPGWAWSRVINTARFGMTKDTNVYNGYIPVGCYGYSYEHEGKTYDMTTIDIFGEKTENNPTGYDVPDVIRDMKTKNGADALYECYAQMKPGDCLVSTGHQLMVTSVNLFTTKSGEIDYTLSTVTVMEQIDAWGKKDTFNDKPLFQQGWVDKSYLFTALEEDNYIPFTFAELLDPSDEQDKKHLDYFYSYKDKLTAIQDAYSAIEYSEEMDSLSVEKGQVYSTLDRNNGSVSVAELEGMSVASNYSVSDVFVVVTDKDGKQLLKNIWRSECYHSREVPLTATRSTFDTDENGNLATLCTGLAELANGENTVEISMQIATGDKLTVFKGALNAN